jgi:hypothetical protein
MALNTSYPGATGFMSAVIDKWLSSKHMSLFTQRSPFFKILSDTGRIQGSGYGTNMREPVRTPTITGPQLQGVTNPYAGIEAQPMTGFTWAQWPLSEYVMDISWEEYDEKRAGGPVEMVNWVQAVLEQGHDKAMNKIMDDLWAAPESANSVGVRNQIMSIRTALNGGGSSATDQGASPRAQASQTATPIVSASGASAQTTVGGIPRAASGAAYWCTPLVNGTPYGSPGATALTAGVLSSIYNQAVQDTSHPNLIVTVDELQDKLQLLANFGGTNGGLMQQPGEKLDLGFDYIQWRRAKIIFDRRCPTSGYLSGTSTAIGNHMFVMNTNNFRLRMDGKKPKFKEVVLNRPIKEQFGTWYMALTANHLGNVHAVGFNLTS